MPGTTMMQPSEGSEPYTYDDGYTEISLIESSCYRAPLADYERLRDAWISGMWKFLSFEHVCGAHIDVRTDRIESIIQYTPHALAEQERLTSEDRARHGNDLPFDL